MDETPHVNTQMSHEKTLEAVSMLQNVSPGWDLFMLLLTTAVMVTYTDRTGRPPFELEETVKRLIANDPRGPAWTDDFKEFTVDISEASEVKIPRVEGKSWRFAT
jgi:hypothetical protein